MKYTPLYIKKDIKNSGTRKKKGINQTTGKIKPQQMKNLDLKVDFV